MTTPKATNFGFLSHYDKSLVHVAVLAERYFPDDPVTTLMKLRQFGEMLAQQLAARTAISISPVESQAEILSRLYREGGYPREVMDLFHDIRRFGNQAVHHHVGDHAAALNGLKIARQLAIWFHRTFTDRNFKPGPFQPPTAPADPTVELRTELERLRAERDASMSELELSRRRAEEAEAARLSAHERALAEAEDRAVWESYAAEADAARVAMAEQLAALQSLAAAAPASATTERRAAAEEAARGIDLDEAATRAVIDARLRDQGWDADTESLRYASGTRPMKGRNIAIAEWPTANGPADYALFVGTMCVGVAEAKRKRTNVSAAVDQAGRYAQGFFETDGLILPSGGPWAAESGASEAVPYRLPFLFAANGRPYHKQIETQSGIWFRDTRDPSNLRRALADWPTPQGLLAQLDLDRSKAQAELNTLPFDFGFPLRDYQKRAIQKVEQALSTDTRRTMLVAMATGTGKTKLAIALLYRLLTAKRFRSICFVVDRTYLGEQAAGEFKTTRIVGPRAFADIFGTKELNDATPDLDTKVHICTIQGLVKRVLFAEPADIPPVDQYDLIVVDECHRGYLLDREMSDQELAFRSQDDYVSKYRRVLEHFDAIKIGLTATPALHTTQIFGAPISSYSYREAVIDGWLIDHDPPLHIATALSVGGIWFAKGDELPLLNPATGEIDLARAPDDLGFEVDSFNKRVITREFNRVVSEELSKHIDPMLPGKTLIFAANDAHADILVDELKQAFTDRYGAVDDAAIMKITGSIDAPSKATRRFRNDANPKVAVTVDLLTTGVDVPSIVNLVFVRRVNSRILYEQMLGRATRPCDEINKETFRIFDAVDIYEALQDLTTMKPVVVDPTLTFDQLFAELSDVEDAGHRAVVRDQIVVRLRRRLLKMTPEHSARFTVIASESPSDTLARIEHAPLDEIASWLRERPALASLLDAKGKADYVIPVSHHRDEHVATTAGYGRGTKPEEYLAAFVAFITSNENKIAALNVLTRRPRELTRSDLKSLAMALDAAGFSEAQLRAAWRDTTNEDIVATIAGYVRQAALGDPLEPWIDRVERAGARIAKRRALTQPQRQWLDRIVRRVAELGVADRSALDEEQFLVMGGFNRINKVFNGQLESVLADINDEAWKETG